MQTAERNLALGVLTVWVQKEQKGLAGPAGNSRKDSWFGNRRKCSQIIKDDNGCFLFCQADLFCLHCAFYIRRERGGVFLHGIRCRTAEEAAAKLARVPSSDLSYIMGSSHRWAFNSALSVVFSDLCTVDYPHTVHWKKGSNPTVFRNKIFSLRPNTRNFGTSSVLL